MAGRREKIHSPTDEMRRQVEAMAGFGLPQDQIAYVMGVCKNTLIKYYEPELTRGPGKANAAVVRHLFHLATNGDSPTAAIFWCKTRLGWRETDRVEVTGANGTAIEFNTINKPAPYSRDQWLTEYVTSVEANN